MSEILDDLKWRGLVVQSTNEEALAQALDAGPITYYCGFDPTASSMHLGNLVQILTMRRLQEAGHKPIAVVGEATGLIGDPKMTGERVLNESEIVEAWGVNFRRQFSHYFDLEGPNAVRIVSNLEWTAPMSALEFLRDVGQHFRVGKMIAKDTVARRLESDQGISYTEFSYQVLQAHDFYELYKRYDCILQTGGNDQWGNLVGGVEYIRKVAGVDVHALTTPLITKADGTKFGKTEEGTVWIDEELTSPYAFYQFWLNTDDRDVIGYLKVFTFLTHEQIDELEVQCRENPAAREAQRALAYEVTTLVHGREAVEKVMEASAALFGSGDVTRLDADVLAQAATEVPTIQIDSPDATVVELLVATGLVQGNKAGRRAINEGGIYLNNVKVDLEDAKTSALDLIGGKWIVLRRGRRTVALVEAKGA